MSPGTSLLILVALVVGSAFFSGAETALVSARRARLEAAAREGRGDARTALALLADPTRTIATILVGTNLCNVGASALATAVAIAWAGDRGPALATIALTPIVLVAGEILPKAFFRHRPTAKLRAIAGALRTADVFFRPAVLLTTGTTRALLALFRFPVDPSGPVFRREDLRSLFSVGEESADIGEDDDETTLRMAGKALDLATRRVVDAMVPLPPERTCPTDGTVADAIARFRVVGGRFLAAVDGEGRVEGFLAARSLLGDAPGAPLAGRVSPAILLDADAPLDRVIEGLRRHQHSVGLVRDRDGRTLGIVTPEDVFEEVVGELTAAAGTPDSTD